MKKNILLLFGLIFLDAFTKVVAFVLLPEDSPGDPKALFHLELAVNHTGLGTAAHSLFAGKVNTVAAGAVLCWVLSFSLIALAYRQALGKWTILGALILALPIAWVGAGAIPSISPETSVKMLRLGQCALWCVVWYLTQAWLWKMGLLLFSSAAIGNTLSLFYPPYGIVDFIWSYPIHRLFGFHIFNLADIMWLIAWGFFATALAMGLVRSFRSQQHVPADGSAGADSPLWQSRN